MRLVLHNLRDVVSSDLRWLLTAFHTNLTAHHKTEELFTKPK